MKTEDANTESSIDGEGSKKVIGIAIIVAVILAVIWFLWKKGIIQKLIPFK